MLQEPNRSIVISSEITSRVAGYVVSQIMEINQLDFERSQALKEYHPEPIELYINSTGGNVTDGFAIIGAMEMSHTPIITYALGIVASMALAIFIAGDARIAHRHARLMFHSISYGLMGHITDHEDMHKEADLLQRMYNELFTDLTNLPQERIDEIRLMKKDFFFSGKQAVKYGIADKVYLKPKRTNDVIKEVN